MPKPWRLTRQAEESLFEIARWTLETFGPRQAEAYEEDLIARCEAIAAGTAHAASCKEASIQPCPQISTSRGPEDISSSSWRQKRR